MVLLSAWLALLVAVLACTESDDPSNWPVERKVVSVARGGFVAADDPQVARFGRWLDILEPRCTQDRSFIGDMVLAGTREAERRGSLVSAERVIGDMVASTSGVRGRVDCTEVVAALVLTY
jgi:hypothetical protein